MEGQILYNITIKIDRDVRDRWFSYMIEEHIPDVMATGVFLSHRMSQMLGTDESEGYTYTIQYLAPSWEAIELYQSHYAPKLKAEHTDMFKDRFVAFRSLMRLINSSDI